RILIDEHEIGELARAHDANVISPERLGAPHRRRTNHFERMKSRFLKQLELAGVVEAVEFEDESRIAAGGDATAAILVVIDELHPDSIIVFPLDLVCRLLIEKKNTLRGAPRLIAP